MCCQQQLEKGKLRESQNSEEERPEISGRIEFSDKGFLDIEGNANEVIDCILKFLSKVYPAYTIVSNLILSLDLVELMTNLKGNIALSDEGPVILKPELPTDISIMLCLIGTYISNRIGKADIETLDVASISKLVGKATKTVRNELPNLTRKGWVDRVGRGEYKVTTVGVFYFKDKILPEL